MMRAVVSSGPPGGNGTTSFAGFVGNDCAAAGDMNASPHVTTSPKSDAADGRAQPSR